MHARPRAQFPHARIREVVHAHGLLSHGLERAELRDAGRVQQAPVVKGLRGPEHDVAVDIVLEMLERLVAATHGPLAAVAREVRHKVFIEARLEPHPVERLDMSAVGEHHDVAQPS